MKGKLTIDKIARKFNKILRNPSSSSVTIGSDLQDIVVELKINIVNIIHYTI